MRFLCITKYKMSCLLVIYNLTYFIVYTVGLFVLATVLMSKSEGLNEVSGHILERNIHIV